MLASEDGGAGVGKSTSSSRDIRIDSSRALRICKACAWERAIARASEGVGLVPVVALGPGFMATTSDGIVEGTGVFFRIDLGVGVAILKVLRVEAVQCSIFAEAMAL